MWLEIPNELASESFWAFLVKIRDKHICHACGTQGSNGDMRAHHINREISPVHKLSNGITLCKDCHYELHKHYKMKHIGEAQYKEFLAEKFWKGQECISA